MLLTAMPSTSTTNPPGIRGANRSRPKSTTKAATPTASVTTLVEPRLAMMWASWRIVSPSPFSIPNSLGSWLTVTKIARPNTKPAITGRDRNCVMNPRRNKPAMMKKIPARTTTPAASAAYSGGVLRVQRGHRREHEHRRRRCAGDDEVTARAEHRIQDQ